MKYAHEVGPFLIWLSLIKVEVHQSKHQDFDFLKGPDYPLVQEYRLVLQYTVDFVTLYVLCRAAELLYTAQQRLGVVLLLTDCSLLGVSF
jgi:hypothetical protein